MNVHAFNLLVLLTVAHADDRRGTICLVRLLKCLSNELFSYSGENALPVNKMSQFESQIKSSYELIKDLTNKQQHNDKI